MERRDGFPAVLREAGEGPIICAGARENLLSLYTLRRRQGRHRRLPRGARRADASPLEPKAFDLLVLLLERQGQVVTKQEILDTVWRQTAVTDNALTRIVAHLRKALGDDARDARYIETVPDARISLARSRRAQGRRAAGRLGGGDAGGARVRPPLAAARLGGDRCSPSWPRSRRSALAYRQRPDAQSGGAGRPLGVADARSRSRRRLDAFPALSPDGRRVAYASDRSGGFEIVGAPLAGGATRDRRSPPTGSRTCSPRGRRTANTSPITRCGAAASGSCPRWAGRARQVTEFGSDPGLVAGREPARLPVRPAGRRRARAPSARTSRRRSGRSRATAADRRRLTSSARPRRRPRVAGLVSGRPAHRVRDLFRGAVAAVVGAGGRAARRR